MKIIQITDLHILGEDLITSSVDCYKNFENILTVVKEEKPDIVVITGDLCFDKPDNMVYRLVKKTMDATRIPYYVIAGNHDNSTMLANIFEHNLIKNECYYDHDDFLFLDSAVGEMSQNQFEWLEFKLANNPKYQYIFMHHPPCHAEVLFMDNSKWTFKQIDKFQKIIHSLKREIFVFAGHYHVERFIKIKNLNVFITPSTYVQIKDDQENYMVDHKIPGYRNIQITNEQLTSTVRYLF